MVNQASHLNAAVAYNKIGSQNIPSFQETGNETQASEFNNVLKQASVSNSIVDTLSNSTTPAANNSLLQLASDAFNKAKDKFKKSEYVSNKALIGQASLIDVVTAINEAEIALQSIINIRDKAIAAYQDIARMQI